MAESTVHEKKSSSWWNDTVTAWCGWTAPKDSVETTWFGRFGKVTCPGCRAALKKGRQDALR